MAAVAQVEKTAARSGVVGAIAEATEEMSSSGIAQAGAREGTATTMVAAALTTVLVAALAAVLVAFRAPLLTPVTGSARRARPAPRAAVAAEEGARTSSCSSLELVQ